MDKFGKKIKEALNEAVNGFEVSDDMKKGSLKTLTRWKMKFW